MSRNQLQSNEEDKIESWFFENSSKIASLQEEWQKQEAEKMKERAIAHMRNKEETSLQTLQMVKEYSDHFHTHTFNKLDEVGKSSKICMPLKTQVR